LCVCVLRRTVYEVYHVRGGEWNGEKEREKDAISVLSNYGLPLLGFLFFLPENTPQGKAAHDDNNNNKHKKKRQGRKSSNNNNNNNNNNQKKSTTRRLDTKFARGLVAGQTRKLCGPPCSYTSERSTLSRAFAFPTRHRGSFAIRQMI